MPSSGVKTCALDRKSTRLNSSHTIISYAVFCLQKKHTLLASRLIPSVTAGHARAALPALRVAAQFPAFAGTLERIHILFFFKDGAPAEIFPFPPPDALPI